MILKLKPDLFIMAKEHETNNELQISGEAFLFLGRNIRVHYLSLPRWMKRIIREF